MPDPSLERCEAPCHRLKKLIGWQRHFLHNKSNCILFFLKIKAVAYNIFLGLAFTVHLRRRFSMKASNTLVFERLGQISGRVFDSDNCKFPIFLSALKRRSTHARSLHRTILKLVLNTQPWMRSFLQELTLNQLLPCLFNLKMVHLKGKEKKNTHTHSLHLGVLASYVHMYFISSADACSIISQSTFTGISLWPLCYSTQRVKQVSRKTQSDRVLHRWRHDNNLRRAHTVKMLYWERLDSDQRL